MRTAILLIIMCSLAGFLFADKIVYATLDWEPYIGEKLPQNGFIAQIIKESFKAAGHEVEFKFYPWARVIAMAQNGEVDCYGPEYYAESLKDNYLISEAMSKGPVGLFRLKGTNIDYKTLEDLKPYKIGVVRDYVNEEKFDAATFLKKEESVDDLTNVRKIYGKRVDLIFSDKYVGLWLAKTNGFDQTQLEFIKPMIEHSLYTCFPKNSPKSKKLIEDFNKGLKTITANGTLKKIIDNKGF